MFLRQMVSRRFSVGERDSSIRSRENRTVKKKMRSQSRYRLYNASGVAGSYSVTKFR